MIRWNSPLNLNALVMATLLGLLLVICLAESSAAVRVCSYCNKEFRGGVWIEVSGKYFHKNHFLCSGCGADLTKTTFTEENGKFYDSACYVRLFVPVCNYCEEPLIGHYTEDESGKYHRSCYENHIALKCSICGEIIGGQYYIDARDNIYHAAHKDELPQCEYCGCCIWPELTGEGQRYSDGRNVCGICLKTAVNSDSEATQITSQALASLSQFGIDIDRKKIPLTLIDRNRMMRISEGSGRNLLGHTTYKKESFLSGLITKKDFEIHMLSGLPRAQFRFAVSHELMHVWLFTNGPDNMEPMLTEGSCDYVGSLVVLDSDDDDAGLVWRMAMENLDPVYGEGLRQIDAYVKRVGIPTWLEYLKENTQPPW